MIINKTVKFKINGGMVKYYQNLGYDIPYSNAEVEIKLEDLTKGSSVLINCVCDMCGKMNHIKYNMYLKNIKKYGYYTCYSKCSNIKKKNTLKERFGKDNYNNREKAKSTMIEKYGVDNYNKTEECKERVIITCLEKYGVGNSLQSEIVKEKIKKTKLEKYGDEHYTNLEKKKITDRKKYGVEHHFQSKEIREKSKQTMIERYGVENSSQYIGTKIKKLKTCKEKYGVEYGFQNEEVKEKIKKTKLEKYGNENYNNPEKNKETCLKKYGVENPQQNPDIFYKQQMAAFQMKKFKDTDLHYQGTYELDFLKKYYDKLNIKNGPTISYLNNKVYFPDFHLGSLNLIVEIKSDYTFNKELEENLSKQKACIDQGYNFIFIINKNYSEFEKLI